MDDLRRLSGQTLVETTTPDNVETLAQETLNNRFALYVVAASITFFVFIIILWITLTVTSQTAPHTTPATTNVIIYGN